MFALPLAIILWAFTALVLLFVAAAIVGAVKESSRRRRAVVEQEAYAAKEAELRHHLDTRFGRESTSTAHLHTRPSK